MYLAQAQNGRFNEGELGGDGDIHDLPLGFRTRFFGCPEFARQTSD